MKIDSSPSARLGKIAWLPLEIRQQFNARLADNEPAQRLVRWLNALPAEEAGLHKAAQGGTSLNKGEDFSG